MRLRWWRRRRRLRAVDHSGAPVATRRWWPQNLGIGPSVTLGFRDGTMVDVQPDSAEGLALRTAAAALLDREPSTGSPCRLPSAAGPSRDLGCRRPLAGGGVLCASSSGV